MRIIAPHHRYSAKRNLARQFLLLERKIVLFEPGSSRPRINPEKNGLAYCYAHSAKLAGGACHRFKDSRCRKDNVNKV
jgi:hypothetical protein